MRKKYTIPALFLVLIMLLTGCQTQTTVENAPELLEPMGVQSDMAEAYIGEIYKIEYYNAAVVPYAEPLYFDVPGAIEKIHVYPGKYVQEGDILLELDQEALIKRVQTLRDELSYVEIDNAYSDALIQLDIELLNTELYHLHQQGAAETQLDLKRNEIAKKEAELRQTQAQREPDLEAKRNELAELEASLDENVLRAPFSGRIAHVINMTNGHYVQAYDPLLYIADDTRLSLSGDYAASSIFTSAHRIFARIGDKDYDISFVPIDQKEYISAVLSGQTLSNTYEFTGSTEGIEAGQYAAVFVISDYVDNALLIPRSALFNDSDGRYVYVDEDGTRVRRPVSIGKSTQALIQITDGLKEGELVYVND